MPLWEVIVGYIQGIHLRSTAVFFQAKNLGREKDESVGIKCEIYKGPRRHSDKFLPHLRALYFLRSEDEVGHKYSWTRCDYSGTTSISDKH